MGHLNLPFASTAEWQGALNVAHQVIRSAGVACYDPHYDRVTQHSCNTRLIMFNN